MASSAGKDAHGGRATQKNLESLTDAVADPVSELNMKTSQDGPAKRTSAENTDPSVADSTEDSPLLSGDEDSNAESGGTRSRVAPESGEEVDTSQETKGLWYILALTISIAGLQMAWAVELSNGSPYLLSLGLSKSLMALVWMAGPLTGTLVVPYVGIVSDNCRSRWGKRRPFMVGGTVATVVGLLFLGWTRELVGGILGLFGADPESQGVRVVIIIAAVVGIYVLDIAINTVQAAIRALIVDCAPAHQQEEANAMASRVTGFGNILGYLAGFVKLHTYLWFLGDNQFKILCALASIGLAATVALSAVFVHERNPQLDGSLAKKTPSILSFFFNILHSIKRLPPQTKRVCQVQFFAWVGFFPLLFYTSSYIGEIYAQPFLEKNPNMKPDELEALYEKATRIGTFALLVNSIVSLVTNVFLPFFIAPTFDNTPPVPVSAAANGQQTSTTSASVARTKQSPLEFLRIPGFTLRRAWLGSLFLFAGSMFCTVLVRSVSAATVLIALAGITWAMTLWAPWAIISAEISRRDVVARAGRLKSMAPRQILLHDADASSPSPSPSPSSSSSHHGLQEQQQEQQQQQQQQEEPDLERNPAQEPHDQAGVILGIHNMAIAVPQMIATLGSSLVFKLIQKPRGTPGDHSFATVMALGGISVLVACVFALKIDDGACKREGGGGGYREEDDGEGLGRRLLSGA
ncbi:related to sucrose transporter SUT1D [Claviceps purpurea 20.1]|uniref:Related to sucrose transporter SUT1D n=1 Tax=Claviceps purpurea (strain 20.1) TaxID=1111077 RepID=M1WFJ3_CLAP2|nr:related to sucrose transporter SUT1D [Claviceps purpurea 20.1]